MQLNRIRVGEALALIGAAVVVVSLFLDWVEVAGAADYVLRGYGAVVSSIGASASGFDIAGWALIALLLLVAALALTLVVLTVAVEPVGLTMASAVATAFFGILVSVLTLLRLALFQPDAGLGDENVTLQLGAYLSLLGVVLCAAGGWITMKDERQSAPYSAAPDLEPRPAPPADAVA
ncbi:hypothetical protein GKE82_03470 [Conexibacter sp. W3-3-2]|uniref:hypothetical protein n=1 Tax=Conexibacter sp. W3-3-2 TaxID=2675227 RepID=UPI0012B7AA16|nr:hypothetical protein [Conexibacter sp. W3-3-2]MTD43386.1 hypothetical protein [Conexibacter sp. W3-3-2]